MPHPPHRYQKIAQGKAKDYIIYKCINCRHFMHESMMIGAEFSCFDCDGKDIVRSKEDLLQRLKCAKCRTGGVDIDVVLKTIEEVKE